MVRDAIYQDFPVILALNLEMEQYLSPMNAVLLSKLHGIAVYHRVFETSAGVIAGFLLAVPEGADYGSPNYRWFAERYPKLLYIDRVVVSTSQQGKGLGAALYDDLFAFVQERGIPVVTCEFDVDPPNDPSRRFHARYGFREVGRQWVAGGKKQVSLQIADMADRA